MHVPNWHITIFCHLDDDPLRTVQCCVPGDIGSGSYQYLVYSEYYVYHG